MEMQALIEEIAALVQKVKDGTATLGELEAFAAATQQLNERAIVLRYKAYEAKVFAQQELLTDMKNPDDHTTGTSIENEPKEEAIGFATVAVTEESEDLSFDLFSMDDDSDSNETAEEIVKQEEPIAEEISEPVMEEPEEPFFEEETPTIIEDIPVEPEFVIETPVVPAPAPAPVSGGGEHPLIRKARINDGSMQSRLLAVRLETLKSAFGLNERMLIVRELFGGSNEAYSEAIESLDNQTEINHARAKVSDYANQYGWKEDNDLAVEFVQKVERRYV